MQNAKMLKWKMLKVNCKLSKYDKLFSPTGNQMLPETAEEVLPSVTDFMASWLFI